MKNIQKGFVVPFLIIIIVALAIGGGIYIYIHNKSAQVNNGVSLTASTTFTDQLNTISTSNNSSTNSQVNSFATTTVSVSVTPFLLKFTISKPELFIYGKGLASVKIYGWPTGTGITQSQQLGSAQLQATALDGTQSWYWNALESAVGIHVSKVDIQGYDLKGNLVSKLTLPYVGEVSLNEVLFPYPRFVFPEVAAEFIRGQTYTLKWLAKPSEDNYTADIFLKAEPKDNFHDTIPTKIAAGVHGESYVWMVPTSISPGAYHLDINFSDNSSLVSDIFTVK